MKLKRLKAIREMHNLTQSDVSKIIGISRASYASFEIGRDTLPLERLNTFVNYFNVSFDYIFEFTDILNYSGYNETIDINVVSNRLKSTRKENKCTQEFVAEILNTNHSVWCRYEQGKYLVKTSFLYGYARKLKLSADYLLGKVDEPKYLN